MEKGSSKKKYEKLSIVPIQCETSTPILASSCADQVTIQSAGQEVIHKDFSSDTPFSVEWDTNFE